MGNYDNGNTTSTIISRLTSKSFWILTARATAAGLIVFIAACAPEHQGYGPDDVEFYQTGRDLEPNLPYISNDPRVISRKKELERLLSPEELQTQIKQLSGSIESVTFIGGLTSTKTSDDFKIIVRVVVSPGNVDELTFNGNLKPSSDGGREIPFTRASGKPNYSLSGACSDSDCKEGIHIVFERVKNSVGKFIPDGRADLFGRGYWATASVSQPSPARLAKLTPSQKSIYTNLQKIRFSYVQNWAVPFGMSSYYATIYTYSGSGEPPKGFKPDTSQDKLNLVMAFSGPSAQTSNHQINAKIDDRGNVRPNDIYLVGDATSSDARLFNLEFKSDGTILDIAMTVKGFESQLKKVVYGAGHSKIGLSANALVRSPTYQTDPRVKKMVDDFEANLDLSGVQTQINEKTANRNTEIVLPYQRISFVRGLIEGIFSHFRVAPPLFYIQITESNYWRALRSNKEYFNPLVLPRETRTSACGPSQILHQTAAGVKGRGNGLGMLVISTDSSVSQANNCAKKGEWGALDENRKDERVYLAAALCGAARYFSTELAAKFEGSDSTLMVAGYFRGPSGAGSVASCKKYNAKNAPESCKVARSNSENPSFFANNYLSFADLVKFNSADKEMIKYVYNFLASYAVLSDPIRHGIEIPDPEFVEIPPYVFPPSGWDSKNWRECSSAISTIRSDLINAIKKNSQYPPEHLADPKPLNVKK